METCTHELRASVLDGRPITCPTCEPWALVFDGFYDHLNKEGGSSRWKCSPDTVRLFVKSAITHARQETLEPLMWEIKNLKKELQFWKGGY